MTKGKRALGIFGAVAAAVGAVFGVRRLMQAAPEKYICPICGDEFDTYEELKQHFDTAHAGEPIEIVWD
jgi:hypothetical protein